MEKKLTVKNKPTAQQGGGSLILSKTPLVAFFSITLVSIGLMLFGPIKLGVDFAGGVVLSFSTSSIVNESNIENFQEQLQKQLANQQFVMQNDGDGHLSIRFRVSDASSSNEVEVLKEKVLKTFEGVVFESVDSIGPQMSKGLISQSVIAMLFAMCAITIYLLIQFNLHMAISGVIVLACDVIISVGFVIICGFEFNLTLVAAFLTLIGYCINDTVVLYDRIRTNIKKQRQAGQIKEVFRKSVQEVLRRSFATSIVTAIGVSGILFFTDSSIVHFAWVVMFGIAIGTFGSVYVASYLPVIFGMKQMRKPPQVKDKMFYAS